MKHQRLLFPVIGCKIREDGLLRVSSIVFIFETIFVQLSHTRHTYIQTDMYMYMYIYIYICELKSVTESTLLRVTIFTQHHESSLLVLSCRIGLKKELIAYRCLILLYTISH